MSPGHLSRCNHVVQQTSIHEICIHRCCFTCACLRAFTQRLGALSIRNEHSDSNSAKHAQETTGETAWASFVAPQACNHPAGTLSSFGARRTPALPPTALSIRRPDAAPKPKEAHEGAGGRLVMMFNQWLLYEMLPTRVRTTHRRAVCCSAYADCRSARFRQNGSWNPSAWVTFRVVAMAATVGERSALTAGPNEPLPGKPVRGLD